LCPITSVWCSSGSGVVVVVVVVVVVIVVVIMSFMLGGYLTFIYLKHVSLI
jgi:hypothetical protein